MIVLCSNCHKNGAKLFVDAENGPSPDDVFQTPICDDCDAKLSEAGDFAGDIVACFETLDPSDSFVHADSIEIEEPKRVVMHTTNAKLNAWAAREDVAPIAAQFGVDLYLFLMGRTIMEPMVFEYGLTNEQEDEITKTVRSFMERDEVTGDHSGPTGFAADEPPCLCGAPTHLGRCVVADCVVRPEQDPLPLPLLCGDCWHQRREIVGADTTVKGFESEGFCEAHALDFETWLCAVLADVDAAQPQPDPDGETVNLTVCLFPESHNPNHGTNYRFRVCTRSTPIYEKWQDLTEAEMAALGPMQISSQFHHWDRP